MKGYQKKIIIFSTIDSIISIPLVYHVVSQKKYKKFKFDIILHYAYVFPTLHESSCIICYQTKATLTHKIAYHTSVCLVI